MLLIRGESEFVDFIALVQTRSSWACVTTSLLVQPS